MLRMEMRKEETGKAKRRLIIICGERGHGSG